MIVVNIVVNLLGKEKLLAIGIEPYQTAIRHYQV